MHTIIYSLIFLIIIQSFFIILSNKSITSILFLISSYVLTSFLFLILGAEFVAIMLIIIYVGAVAVLFIFVIMMLNVRVVEVYNSIIYYLPIGLFLGIFFLIEIIYMIINDFGVNSIYLFVDHIEFVNPVINSNMKLLAEVLFNEYYLLVLFLCWLLLVGMIGAIALTIDVNQKNKNTNVYSVIKVDHLTYFWGMKQKKLLNNQ